MAEFMANNQNSEFADTNLSNDEKKRSVLTRLTQIIRKHTMQGLGFAVNVREYNVAVPEPLRANTGKYHYTFALRLLIGLFEQYREMHDFAEPTEYIFDRMTKGDAKAEIVKVFNEAENLEDELHKYGIYEGCLSFRDKYDVLPLQASDMTAWLINQKAQHETEGIPAKNQVVVECWNALVKDNHLYSGVVRERHLTRWIEKERTTPGTGTYELFQELQEAKGLI